MIEIGTPCFLFIIAYILYLAFQSLGRSSKKLSPKYDKMLETKKAEEMFWDQYWKLSHISDQAHTCIADSEIWMITKRHDCNGEDDDEYLEELDRINRRRKEELYRLEAEANKHIEKIKRMNKESGELFNSIKNDLYNIKEKKDD